MTDKNSIRSALWVFVYPVVIAVGVGLVVYFTPEFLLPVKNSVFIVFFSAFGTIYAITTGFVMLIVINNHSDVKNAVRLEVNSLRRLRDYLKYVDDDTACEHVRASIRTYCQSVLEKEWPDMVSDQETSLVTSPELHELMNSVKTIDHGKAENAAALTKIMDALGDLIVYRSDRLAYSLEKLPPMLKHLMFVLSLLIGATFFLLPIEVLGLRVYLNCVNVFAVAYIFAIIVDLNNPFKGFWRVTPQRMKNFVARV